MRTNKPFRRNFRSTAVLMIALSSPALALAGGPTGDRAAAASDPEYSAGYLTRSTAAPQSPTRNEPESAAARASAASDPENAAAYDETTAARRQEPAAASPSARSAMASDPDNVASHTAG